MSLAQVTAGNRILTTDLNAYFNLLKGVAASGEAITLVHNAGSIIFQPGSDPAAGTEAFIIKNAAGTVLGALSYDGKLYAADGTAALPGLTFEGDKDTGFYHIAANTIGAAVAGAIAFTLSSSVFNLASGIKVQENGNNIQPMTTSGDVIYGGASGVPTRLAKGTDGQVLTLASGLPSWASGTGLDRQVFTSSGTWTKPAGAKWALVIAIGAGGGGGGGHGGNAGTDRHGGSAGGGGAFVEAWLDASGLGSTETVTIGAAGASGPGGSAGSGTAGGAGGDTSFGSHLTAYGGAGGGLGSGAGGGTGGGGGGLSGAGGSPTGGAPAFPATLTGLNVVGPSGATGGNSATPTDGGNSERGGAGGGSGNNVSTAGSAGGSSLRAGAGGGGGGGVSSGNVERAGGAGGAYNSYTSGGGGAAGAANGGAGTSGTSRSATGKAGSGGGGGGGQDSGTGGAGGDGGAPGGGAGGGAGGTTIGGAGGAGGRGEIIVITFA